MKKKSFFIDLMLFVGLSILFSASYYFFYRNEIVKTKDYEFIMYSIIGASSVIFLPLIQKIFKRR